MTLLPFRSLWQNRIVFGLPTFLLLVCQSAGAPGNEKTERGASPLAQALLDGRSAQLDTDALARGLSRGGAHAVSELFEVLERGRFDVRVGDIGTTTKSLTPIERAALLDALGRQPWQHVQDYLIAALKAGPDESCSRTALLVLGAHGSPPDLPLMTAFVVPEEAGARISRPLRSAFGSALGVLLSRDETAFDSVGSLYAEAPRSLLPSIVKAVGERPTRAGLTALGDLLGRVPAADKLVLAELGHVANTVNDPVDPEVGRRVRAYLIPGPGPLRAEAIIACGRLEDPEAVPPLIELMRTGERNERRLAHQALGSITGKLVAPDPDSWALWYETATEWKRVQVPIALEEVRSGSREEASRAILELSKRKHLRHELTPSLADGLQREEEELVLLTCAALGHLASPLAVPYLLESLEDERVEVRRASYLALRRLTAEDHGEASQDWVAAGW